MHIDAKIIYEKITGGDSMVIAIPALDNNGLKSRISEHFGRAPYFAIVELTDEKIDVKHIANTGEHFHGGSRAIDVVINHNASVVIAHSMGQKALDNLHQAGITVLKTIAKTVEEAVFEYKQGKLPEMTESHVH